MNQIEAKFYEKIDNNLIKCTLCPHNCIIKNNGYGICKVRKNIDGKLYAENYGKVSAIAIDPIEKKPLFHFYPAKNILSFGTIGCNLKCPYCQNWHISQNIEYPVEYLTPEDAVDIALSNNLDMIAYTYSEPIVWYEFVYDTAKIAKKNKIKNVLVTNGFINLKPLKELVKYIDGANIDVKAFNDKFYSHLVHGKLENVLETVEFLYDKIHIELTMLIIPGWNDNLDEIKEFVKWVKNLNPDIAVHFSRYFPQYKFNKEPTPLETLEKIYEIAKKELNYVYLGNVAIKDKENTYCPYCGNLLIKRSGYNTKIIGLEKNVCTQCHSKIPIIL